MLYRPKSKVEGVLDSTEGRQQTS